MHWIDPGDLPLVRGTIERFIVDSQGQIDGIVLQLGEASIRLVHFPSHMADDIAAIFRQGDQVGIRGAKLRVADVIAAVAIERADGAQVIDCGPPKRDVPRTTKYQPSKMSAVGKVRLTIFTSKGRPRGALLDDGTTIRMPLKLAEQVKERLRPGEMIDVTGTGFETAHGRIIQVHNFSTPIGQYVVAERASDSRRPNKTVG